MYKTIALIDELLKEPFGSRAFSPAGGFPWYVYKQPDKYVVVADLPGVAKEDINIKVDDCFLDISAERKAPELAKDENVIVGSTITYGTLSRSLKVDRS